MSREKTGEEMFGKPVPGSTNRRELEQRDAYERQRDADQAERCVGCGRVRHWDKAAGRGRSTMTIKGKRWHLACYQKVQGELARQQTPRPDPNDITF